MKIKPWLALFLLAPAIGEVTCGNTPPAKFVDVPGLVLMAVLYGGGALMVREIVVRGKLGWGALLLLGAAYGIVEEGLTCKSFFDPNWPGIEQLGVYGRYGGVNWIWSVFLTVYHAVYSIGFSILVAEVFYPLERDRSWVSTERIPTLAVLFAAVVALGYAFFPGPKPYQPATGNTAGAFFAVVLFAALAFVVPRSLPCEGPARPLAVYAVTGFLAPVLFFYFMYAGPSSGLHPAFWLFLAAFPMAASVAFMANLVRAGGGWDRRRQVAFIAGVLLSMMALGLLVDLSRKFAGGMPLVAVAEIALVVVLSKRVSKPSTKPPPVPVT